MNLPAIANIIQDQLSVDDITVSNKKTELVEARYIFMSIADSFGFKNKQIHNYLQVSHSTVSVGLQKHEQYLLVDQAYLTDYLQCLNAVLTAYELNNKKMIDRLSVYKLSIQKGDKTTEYLPMEKIKQYFS